MLDYIRAEGYKVSRRAYPYVTLLVLLAGAALLISGWVFTNSHGNDVDFASGGGMAVMLLSVGLYAPVLIGDMVFSEQYKNNTLKNEVSYGLPRARIYLGKLTVAAVLGILMSLAVLVFYEGMCWLTLLPGEPGNAAKALEMVIYCTLAALPQWLGMLGVSIMAYFLVRSSTVAAILIVLILVVPQNALKLLGLLVHPAFGNAAAFMPSAMVEAAQTAVGDGRFLALSWGLGAAWLVGATVVGLVLFRRKEIN